MACVQEPSVTPWESQREAARGGARGHEGAAPDEGEQAARRHNGQKSRRRRPTVIRERREGREARALTSGGPLADEVVVSDPVEGRVHSRGSRRSSEVKGAVL